MSFMDTGIVAVSKDGVIGVDGNLPWSRIPEDMAHFSHITKGQIVVMGKNTYYSLPEKHRPLKDRINVVLTHSRDIDYVYTLSPESFTDTCLKNLKVLHPQKKIIFIGGRLVYQKASENEWIKRWYVTRINYQALEDKHTSKNVTHWDEGFLKGFKLIERSPLGKTDHYLEVYER